MSPRPSIDQVRKIQNFQSLFQWNVLITKFPKAGNFGLDSDDFNLRCESTEMPKKTAEPIIINVRGHKVRQEGIHSYAGVMTFTMLETVDTKIREFIHGWSDAIWQPKTGIQQPKVDLEAIFTIEQLNSKDEPVYRYKLTGVQLEDFELGTLDGVSSDVQKPTITVGYDYFETEAIST